MPAQPRKTTSNDAKAKLNYDVKEKILQNALVPINKLPKELLKRIVHLIDSVDVSYTSVCHHWRSVLAQSSVKDSLIKESKGISTLRLKAHGPVITQQAVAGKQFSSLPASDAEGRGRENPRLESLPFVKVSDDMQTLRADLEKIPDDTIDRLAPVLRRISKLSLTIHTPEILHSVLDLLHNNTNLHTLELLISNLPPFTFSSQTILPELQFLTTDSVALLDGIRAPILSSLDIQCSDTTPVVFKNPSVLQEFGCSSIQYLHILDREDGGHTILGLKKPIHPKSIFSIKSDIYKQCALVEKVNEMTFLDDYLSDPWPRDYFRLNFVIEDTEFTGMLRDPLFSILPQLTGLSELCLASDILYTDELRIDEILTMVPSLEVLMILHDEVDEDVTVFLPCLDDPSLCPRLKHLSYLNNYRNPTDEPEMLEELGELLTATLQSRHNVHGDMLKRVVIGYCAPLPDTWLQKIQNLGTTVVASIP